MRASLRTYAALVALMGVACSDPAPGPSSDLGVDQCVGACDAGADAAMPDDLGPDDAGTVADLGTPDGGPMDAGMTDLGPDNGGVTVIDMGTADPPMITSVSWEPPNTCSAGSGLTVFVAVTDANDALSSLTVNVAIGTCVQGMTTAGSGSLQVELSGCAHTAPVAGVVQVRDPGNLTDLVTGFVVQPCAEGSYSP